MRHRIRSAALRESTPSRKRQSRAAGFPVWGWHDFELSESLNNRARILDKISNFPSFSTCSCELFGQEIELSESGNIESSGSRLGKFNFLPFSASPMYLPPESSVSCHLHETASALRHPRVLTLRFRAHTKNAGVLPLPCSCTNAGASASAHSRLHAKRRRPSHTLCPRPLPKRRRDGVCAPSRLSASRYLNRLPLWARLLSVGFWMPPAPSACGRHPIVGRFASFAAHW